MRQNQLFALAVVLSFSTICLASQFVVPNTTLAAQTSNNTSAANAFATQSNGNRGRGNISKVNIRSLLYRGATTKVYAHLMLWFGQSNHMNVGYSSNDAAQVKRQINDMISRHIDGVIIDWYGPNNFIDQATKLVMAEAENHPGFTFAIMVDQGAIQWDSCSGCNAQQALIQQLQYVERTYFPSPAYMRIQGAPVITNFNIDLSYSVDWNAVNAALSTHPRFMFQNNDGFSHMLSDGSYSWVMPTTSDYGMGYLTNFYDTGLAHSSAETFGAGYKGFNDTLASWGSHRIMSQRCGQTWLQTFSNINTLYNSGKQLPYLQLVTWNDYEEGTEIESGVDNCVGVSASVSGNGLQWTTSGSESTLDHYKIYISTDGSNLMALAAEAVGIHSLNLCSFPVPAGQYQLFVQAVGKPGLSNQISGPVKYSSTCATSVASSNIVSLTASPAAQTIKAGQSAIFTITAAVQSGTFGDPISLSCANLPTLLNCSFLPSAITPVNGVANSTLTMSAISAVGTQLGERRSRLVYGVGWFPLGLAGMVFIGTGDRRRNFFRRFSLLWIFGLSILLTSCGAAAGRPTYSITVQGNSQSMQLSTNISVSVP